MAEQNKTEKPSLLSLITREAIIRLLLAAGVAPHAIDICCYTARTYARIFGASPEMEALLNSPEKLIA